MAFTETGNEGSLNGTTAVDIVAAPSSGNRHVIRSVKICNKDTAAVTIEVYKDKGGTEYRIWRGTLDVNDTIVFDEGDIEVLDATNEALKAEMSGAAATTNPTFTASYAVVN